ncbi:acyl-CoA reductase [Polyangium aurulentum]|uniref:acyl-CoA reductase n=1 Tax=Polyangium aurulentum TaxID=2567896 RepID=UPI0010ADC902|nr:acyl-CoA reductase [Polyangium aurulentum]UQA61121.1 proline dehydrogenase [Polyangium aurulentum]
MSRDEGARDRVLRVVAAGRRVADPADPLGQTARRRLLETSGLSAEGIELALCEHLETRPTDADIDALVASCGAAPRCHVVLSANVPTGALRAIALGVATSREVFVRPSRRDPVLAELLVEALRGDDAFVRAGGGSIALVEHAAPAPSDELHVYGSDAAVRALEEASPEGVVIRGHGSGLGLAVVGASVELEHAARAVARDVVPFDQRGCLSPRMVLVEGDGERVEALGRALVRALDEAGARVPRGPIDAATEAEIALYRAAMEAVGELHAGRGCVVGIDPAPRSLPLPPAARVVHMAAASSGDVNRLLARWASLVTTVGVGDDGELARSVLACVPWARRAQLGCMQRPPLDGPVDRRPQSGPRPRAAAGVLGRSS